MTFVIIALVAFSASLLSFFSGFGLGTLLMAAFAFFFPIEMAIGMTAVVHFANNILKLVLLRKNVNLTVAVLFGIPAVLFALVGAALLNALSGFDPIGSYVLLGSEFFLRPVNLVIATLMVVFLFLEFRVKSENQKRNTRSMMIGGALSGFFGGLSGHQGALRSAFLVRLSLPRTEFIATGVIIACGIDVARLGIYSFRGLGSSISQNSSLVIVAVLAAFLGVVIGNRLLKKVSDQWVRKIVMVALVILSIAIGLGWV